MLPMLVAPCYYDLPLGHYNHFSINLEKTWYVEQICWPLTTLNKSKNSLTECNTLCVNCTEHCISKQLNQKLLCCLQMHPKSYSFWNSRSSENIDTTNCHAISSCKIIYNNLEFTTMIQFKSGKRSQHTPTSLKCKFNFWTLANAKLRYGKGKIDLHVIMLVI